MLKNLTCIALVFISLTASAQTRKFPYQAQITVDEAYVRSGGGDQFYPTTSLERGSIVKVLRHDPGGWCMIEPPKGSFSWVPTRYVRSTSGASGEIIDGNVVVFVGSGFGDETNVWQRRMQAGEKVTILGVQQVDTLSGPREMYKIVPPAREFRWVPGSAIVPTDKAARERRDRNPYQVPSEIAEQQNLSPKPSLTQSSPTARAATPRYSPGQGLVKLKQIREEQRALQELDQRFRYMILSDPSQWDLDKLERDYLELQNKSTYKPIAGQIDLRYPAIYRYRQRKAQLEDFNRMTSETEKRDAQLMASQFGLPAPAVASTPPLSSNVPAVAATSFGPTVEFNSELASPPVLSVPSAGFEGAPVANSVSGNSKYIGAGFLQKRGTDSSQQYLLTSPTGDVLAQLTPDGTIDLDKFIGQSVGLQGKRWFDPDLKTDRIEVSNLEPVNIRK